MTRSNFNTIEFDTIEFDTIEFDTIEFDTIEFDTIEFDTIDAIGELGSHKFKMSANIKDIISEQEITDLLNKELNNGDLTGLDTAFNIDSPALDSLGSLGSLGMNSPMNSPTVAPLVDISVESVIDLTLVDFTPPKKKCENVIDLTTTESKKVKNKKLKRTEVTEWAHVIPKKRKIKDTPRAPKLKPIPKNMSAIEVLDLEVKDIAILTANSKN
ncbi:MAG: hypothetical protein ACRC1D_04725 [Culicoidibacterales bacterium]